MGNVVTIGTGIETQKPDFTTAVTAAASVVIGQDDLVIFVGANVATRYTEAVNAVKRCFRALSANSNATPSSTQLAYARLVLPQFGKADLEVNMDAVSITLTEDDIVVAYGDLFQAYANQGLGGQALKALEVYQETYAKKGG